MNRADYNVGNLESEIKVQFDQAVSALNQTTTALDGVVSLLKDTNSQLNNLKNNTGLKDLQKQSMSFSDAFKSTVKLGAIYGVLRKGFSTVRDITSASIDMIETTNLFEVQMGKVVDQYGNLDEAQSQYYTKAMAFQDKMNEKLATNKSEMQKYQAMYYGMLNSQLGSKNRNASYFMSENLTKAGYDIASLYNLDVETAMNKLKSGLAGQIESLRQIGIDVSEASLAKVLDEVGIDRSVQQLSYAEKEIARYIAIVEQAGQAQGDFARTFEQPANQIRVFKNQMLELKQVAGSFFVGLFGQIMPVINGIIMAIKEVLKALGSVFGFEVDTGNTTLGTVADTVGDIDSGIGSATKKAKEFKKQLMGFDEINNIEPPSKNNGGSGSGGSITGVDSKLLDALKKWDNKMDSISGKAQEIRDKILDWLGVTDGSYENLKKIWEIAKLVGIAIGTWKIASTVSNFFKSWGKLSKTQAFQLATGITLTITGLVAQFQGTKQLISGNWSLFNLIETALGTAGGALGIVSIMKALKLGKDLSLGQQLSISFGAMFEIQGLQVSYTAMKDLSNGVTDLNTALGKLTIGLGESIGAGALIGSVFGPMGAVIGAVAGAIINLTTASIGYQTESDKVIANVKETTKSTQEYISSLEKTREEIIKTANTQLAEIDYIEKITGELDTLVDENGKVKEGYEGRVKFILEELSKATGEEWQLVDGTIQKYKQLRTSINDLIAKKKAEIILNANEEIYSNAIKKQVDLYKQKIEQQKAVVEAQKKYNDLLEQYKNLLVGDTGLTGSAPIDLEITKAKEALSEAQKVYDDVVVQWEKNTNDIISYEHLQTSVIKDDNEEIQESIIDLTSQYNEEGKKIESTLAEQIKMQSDYVETAKGQFKKLGKDINNDTKKQLEMGLRTLAIKLVEQTSTIEKLTPEQIEAWQELAESSQEIYNENISQINKDTALLINVITNQVETSSPEFINKWKEMSQNSKRTFIKELETLPEDTQGKILASIIAVDGMNEDNEKAYKNLSSKAVEAFNTELSKMKKGTKEKIEASIEVINNKTNTQKAKANASNLANSAIQGANSKVKDKKTGAYSIGNYFVSGFLSALNSKGSLNGAFSAGFNLIKSALSGGNNAQQTGSPAKETIKMGNFFTEGYIVGLKKKQEEVRKASSGLVGIALGEFQQLNQGIKINTKDFAVDANQYINYGAIKGQIQAQSQVSMNDNIAERIAEAVTQSMRNAEFNVNIEAKTEEGVIVKKVVNADKEYRMQTGQPLFAY